MANLITGDAVTLDLRIAGLPSRTLALAVDVTLQVLALMAGTVLVSWVFSAGGSPGAQAAVTLGLVVLVLVGLPTLVETMTRGRSLGKVMMGLRVLRDDGGPTRMRHSLVRALSMVFLDLWVTSGVVGGISALASSKSKRMGDHLAGTIVVGERIPRGATRHHEITMPPPLAGWAAGLDLVAVPDTLALNVRTFLHRAPGLDPTVRESTARRLATQMAGYVRTPAPAGTPAEAYLAAVLAERTKRSAAGGRGAAGSTAVGSSPNPGPPGQQGMGGQPALASPPEGRPAQTPPGSPQHPQPGPGPSTPGPWAPPSTPPGDVPPGFTLPR